MDNIAGLPGNDAFLAAVWSGPREVNMNYCPRWGGDDHICVASPAKPEELKQRETIERMIMRRRRAEYGISSEGI